MIEHDKVSGTRNLEIDALAKIICSWLSRSDHLGKVVGIDGPDCSGKTLLAEKIAAAADFAVNILHFDDYIGPLSELEPVAGFFPVEAFLRLFRSEWLLNDLRAHAMDCSTTTIVEGLFLAQPEVRQSIDVLIRMEIAEQQVFDRAMKRDVGVLGNASWVRNHYVQQCIPAQAIYRSVHQPEAHASLIVHVGRGNLYELRFKDTPRIGPA